MLTMSPSGSTRLERDAVADHPLLTEVHTDSGSPHNRAAREWRRAHGVVVHPPVNLLQW